MASVALLQRHPHLSRASDLPPPRTLATGIAALDRVLPNQGIPLGHITELHGPASSGKLTLAQSLLRNVLRHGRLAAWVDLTGTFYPVGLPESIGAPLIVRPPNLPLALKATHILLHSRQWELVVADLSGSPKLASPQALQRLSIEAKEARAALVILHDHPTCNLGIWIALRLQARRCLSPQGRILRIALEKARGQRTTEVAVPLSPEGGRP